MYDYYDADNVAYTDEPGYREVIDSVADFDPEYDEADSWSEDDEWNDDLEYDDDEY